MTIEQLILLGVGVFVSLVGMNIGIGIGGRSVSRVLTGAIVTLAGFVLVVFGLLAYRDYVAIAALILGIVAWWPLQFIPVPGSDRDDKMHELRMRRDNRLLAVSIAAYSLMHAFVWGKAFFAVPSSPVGFVAAGLSFPFVMAFAGVVTFALVDYLAITGLQLDHAVIDWQEGVVYF